MQLTTEEFTRRAIIKHGLRYDYSRVEYKNSRSKVIIVCGLHGEFNQCPTSHLGGYGCKMCSGRMSYDNNSFIKLASRIHKNRYDYSNVHYKTSKHKVFIVCKIHGLFQQIPNAHIRGVGCPECNCIGAVSEVKLYDNIRSIYPDLEVLRGYRPAWLGMKQHLDIFIPSLRKAIEYQGQQHFAPVKFFGGVKALERLQFLDKRKRDKCVSNGIKLLYFTYDISYVPVDYPYKVYNDISKIIKI